MDNSVNKKRCIISLVVLGIFFMMYNVILLIFDIAFGFSPFITYWVSYVMMFFAFMIVGITNVICLFGKTEPKDWFLRFPIYRHSIIYFVIEFVFTTICMIFSPYIPWFLSLPVNIIILGLHIVIVISSFFVKSHITNLDNKIKDKTAFIKLLKADVDLIVEKAQDPEVRQAFVGLSEQVRYSDPMSSETLFELEKQILECLGYAQRCVESNKKEAALQNCEIASRLLYERNQKTKALK